MNGAVKQFPMSCNPALRDMLLDHLRTTKANFWHGIDGLTLDDALNSYCEAAVAGQVPGKEQLLCQHPELAAELETFFTAAQACSEKAPTDQSSVPSTAAIRVDSIEWD
jgi:hypothetical protein